MITLSSEPRDELPVGTVTFLFTDIEGSTRLLKLWRERYGEALSEHQRILRNAFALHGGHEIDTQGDSFFVAFRRAKDAVAAAVECQRHLAAQQWPDGDQLRVRMGIHTGEPAAAGERYVGLGVHRAARICAAGHGGQVLTSQTTRELLRDDPSPDISLRDLGQHQLKDLDEPERLYQLVAQGLDEAFPALKTAAPIPFAGREGELAAAAAHELTHAERSARRRMLVLAALAVAAVGTALGVVLMVSGGSTAGAVVKANSVGVIDSSNGRLASAISVGTSPGGMAAGEGAVWVTNTGDNTVSRIDPATNTVGQVIQVGNGPTAVTVGGGAVWVANGLDGTVSRIDPTVNRTVDTIQVGNGPAGVAYGERAVWVANSVDGTVSRIDPTGRRATRTVPAVVGATGVAVGFGRIWVVSASTGVAVSLDPTSLIVVDRIAVGVDPDAVATGSGAVWVANRADGTVSKIDPNAPAHVAAAIQVGRGPNSIAVAKGGVWVANGLDGTVARIDASTDRPAKPVRLAYPPSGLAVAPSGVYVAMRSNGLEHRGGTLRIADAALDFLDPALAYTQPALSILSITNDGLVAFRKVGGIEGAQLVPDLAISLPLPTDDGRTYRFQLRPGVRYSNGRPVQPEDLRAELERVFSIAGPSPGRQYYSGIVGSERCAPGRSCDLSDGIVTDDAARTVTFHLRAPDADFLTKLALSFAVAVPAATPPRDIASHAVPATGPYIVAAYQKGRSVRLTRNPRFHQWSTDAQPAGYPDQIAWKFATVFDSVPLARAVEQGAADIAPSLIAPPLSKQLLAGLATRYPSQLHLNAARGTSYFFLNTRVAPFDDVRVRRAVNDALDRQAFAQQLGLGFEPTCQILPPNFPSFRRICPYGSGGAASLDRARQVISRSGNAGTAVTVWVPPPRRSQGVFMVALLNGLGFRGRLKVIAPVPSADAYFAAILDSRTHAQMGFYAWYLDFPSAADFLPLVFSCAVFVEADPLRNQDPSAFCDPKVDRLLSKATTAQSLHPAAATALWQKAERAILAQAPLVPTFNQQDISFVSRRVGNFQYNPEAGVLLDQLWVK